MSTRSWQTIAAEAVAPPSGIFSHGSVIPISDTLTYIHTSGLTSRDANGEVVGEGDIEKQTAQVLTKLRELLAEVGCTLDDVFKILVFITDMAHFDAIHRVRKEYFTPPYPASTMVQVSRMVDPRSLIEIEAIACRPRRPGDGAPQ